MPASARFLLEGFWYSVEQSGQLLHSSTALYDAGHFGASAGLALLATEELGKGRILLDLWTLARAGKSSELGQVKKLLADHERKLEAGQTLFPLAANQGSPQWEWLQVCLTSPNTPEGREALVKIAALALKRGKRTASDRHEARQRAFYVDPDPSGTMWLRPVETTKEVAQGILISSQSRELAEPQGALGEALDEWPERPPLPERIWPKS